jgi:ribosome-binding factor A
MARKDRVESALREELATIIAREVKDPRVSAAGLIGVTRVECTQDLSVARVYVSIYGDDAVAKKALAGLAASASFLRGPVGRRLNLQRPPELRFVRDESAELNIRLASILREDEAKAREAGRGPGATAASSPDAGTGSATGSGSGSGSDSASDSASVSASASDSASVSASASGSGSGSGSGSDSDPASASASGSGSGSGSGSAADADTGEGRADIDPDLDAGSGPDPAPDVG